MIEEVKKNCEEKMKKTVAALKEEFNMLRTGRASSALFDKIRVSCYGESTPLNQLANISIPEARILLYCPFEKRNFPDIKAVRRIKRAKFFLHKYLLHFSDSL